MEEEWEWTCKWCRLCGRHEASKDMVMNFPINLMEITKKIFSIELFTVENYPVTVCTDCIKFSIKLEEFSRKCIKVDKMFTELINSRKDGSINENFTRICYKYGIDYSNFESCELPIDKYDSLETTDIVEDVQVIKPDTDAKEMRLRTNRKMSRTVLSKSKYEKNATRQYKDTLYIKEEKGPTEDVYIEGNKNNVDKGQILTWDCPVCAKSFEKAQLRNVHLKSEHGNIARPFKCMVCPKTFPTALNLKLHGHTHLPESEKMVHKCPHCEKCFSKSVNAKAHIQYTHIAHRNYICEECGKSFNTKCQLKDHYLTHSEERPLQCLHCTKSFKNRQQLKIHEDTHSGTSYECSICNKVLNTKRNLNGHMKVHSDEKQFHCHLCRSQYKRKKALKLHIKKHHMADN